MTARTSLPFIHRIIRHSDSYKIQTACAYCGAKTYSVRTERIVEWERNHICGSEPAAKRAKPTKLSRLVRHILRAASPSRRRKNG
jgi:hypothetical protein